MVQSGSAVVAVAEGVQAALSLLLLHSIAALGLVVVFLAEFLEGVHVLHQLVDPQLIMRHTEFNVPVRFGHENHGINGAAKSGDLSTVVSNQGSANCFVPDTQAAVNRHLSQGHCAAAAGDEEDAEEELGIAPRSHDWLLSWRGRLFVSSSLWKLIG